MVNRLVVADDTDDVRALLRLILGHHGFEVVAEAANGVEAVALTHQHQPDAVVLDLAMPLMSGIEAIPYIRRHAPLSKVVVFTGFDARLREDEAFAAGADAYVEKGEPAEELVAVLAEVLGRERGGRLRPV